MRLRKQLVFLSLITLALPWVGCQYIKEVDTALRQGQTNALTATADAVSARIASDTQLLAPLKAFAALRAPLYAHALRSSIYLDGYADDWIAMDKSFQQVPGFPTSFYPQIVMGERDDKLFFFLRAKESSIDYFTPTEPMLEKVDHLIINTQKGKFRVFSSAPGKILAARDSKGMTFNDKVREHLIKGYWTEWESGYQIEISLPLDWTSGGIRLGIHDGNQTRPESESLEPLLSYSDELDKDLANFATEGMRLHILSPQGHLLATAGQLTLTRTQEQQHGFVMWLYRLALGKQQYPELITSFSNGSPPSEDVRQTLDGNKTVQWFSVGNHPVARVGTPVNADGQAVGAVIAEQSAMSLTSVTSDAFSKLLAYSFIVSSLAALALIAYATWLSWRIRRLSEAAANAVSESGKISEDFPVLAGSDEIGELSRNYAQLLARLREYTNYLRTLSSKLSHELRTPLAIVRSSLDNLEHEKLGKQARVYAERAREGTTRLSSILNAMSAASRVEQAIGMADRETIPCDRLLENLKAAYEDVYPHVNFKLNIRPHPRGLSINGAGELLVQAFDKLIDNAADFCPKGGLIELGLYRHQNTIVFTFRNEGPPLPSHMQGQLFDSMVSVRDAQAAKEGQHLGLGLYVVRLITDFHHGEVQGYNIPDGSGAIFEVKLPAKD